MDKDVKALICDIILLLLIMVISIPICVNASRDYNKKKYVLQSDNNISVSISNENSNFFVNIYNYNSRSKTVNLILKTSKFSNNYNITLDDKFNNLDEIARIEDDNYYYFYLGSYKIKKHKQIKFDLNLMGDEVYDDSIKYSFLTEALN